MDKNTEEISMNSGVIDLGIVRKKQLNEFILTAFKNWVKLLLGSLFTGSSIPVTIKGTEQEVKSFAKALQGEKKYMEAFKEYGLDDPKTYKNKLNVEKAVKEFERKTSIKWPFK